MDDQIKIKILKPFDHGLQKHFYKNKRREIFETPYKFPLKYGIIRERRVPLPLMQTRV